MLTGCRPPSRVFACPERVVWARDAGGIVVVDERGGAARLLWGLECAVWSWLSLGYSYAELAGFTSELLGLPGPEAQASLDRILADWLSAGWLEEKEPVSG